MKSLFASCHITGQYAVMKKISQKLDLSLPRCHWAGQDPLYARYHDEEWGVPVHDDKVLFEFLLLESAQAGLSWITILRRREGYRRAFANFDPRKVARFDARKVRSLMKDEGIIRHEKKILSAIQNARAFLAVQKEFGSFDRYLWAYVDGKPLVRGPRARGPIPAQTELSVQLSKDLKDRGFQFLGPTIVYAYMQAVGLVNDHVAPCFCVAQ